MIVFWASHPPCPQPHEASATRKACARRHPNRPAEAACGYFVDRCVSKLLVQVNISFHKEVKLIIHIYIYSLTYILSCPFLRSKKRIYSTPFQVQCRKPMETKVLLISSWKSSGFPSGYGTCQWNITHLSCQWKPPTQQERSLQPLPISRCLELARSRWMFHPFPVFTPRVLHDQWDIEDIVLHAKPENDMSEVPLQGCKMLTSSTLQVPLVSRTIDKWSHPNYTFRMAIYIYCITETFIGPPGKTSNLKNIAYAIVVCSAYSTSSKCCPQTNQSHFFSVAFRCALLSGDTIIVFFTLFCFYSTLFCLASLPMAMAVLAVAASHTSSISSLPRWDSTTLLLNLAAEWKRIWRSSGFSKDTRVELNMAWIWTCRTICLWITIIDKCGIVGEVGQASWLYLTRTQCANFKWLKNATSSNFQVLVQIRYTFPWCK